jgi:hypothetical protein
MKIVRSIAVVVLGYLLFALPSYAFFRITGQAPHQPAPLGVMAASILVGVVAAFAGGYCAGRLAPARPLAHAVAVALLLGVGATVSLLGTLGSGAIWSQLAALLLMAPAAVLGGVARARQVARRD